MTTTQRQLFGSVVAVLFQDGQFRVVKIAANDPGTGEPSTVVVSGREFGPIYPGLAVTYQLRSAGSPIYNERAYIERRLDQIGVDDARSAGVWAFLVNGGVPVLTRLADSLAGHFAGDLADVLLTGGQRLVEHPLIGEEDLITIGPEVADIEGPLRAAAKLGQIGLDWVIEPIVHSDLGRRGPETVMVDPFYLVNSRVAGYESAVLIADHLELPANDRLRIFGAADAMSDILVQQQSSATTSQAAARILGDLLGGSAAGVMARLIEDGRWAQRDKIVAPGKLFVAADTVLDQLDRLEVRSSTLPAPERFREPLVDAERIAVQEACSNGVTLIDTPDGAPVAWLRALRDHCAEQGWGMSVLAPDARGALYTREEVELNVVPDPTIVVVVDAHRFSYTELARLTGIQPAGVHFVVAGDTWLWSPADGGNVVKDLIEINRFPVVNLPGLGSAWEFRRRGVLPQGTPRIENAPQDNRTPLIQMRSPSTPRRKRGFRVMAAQRLSDRIGLGSVGEIEQYERGTWLVSFDDLGTMQVTGAGKLCGYDKVPAHHLPGIALPRLALAIEHTWREAQIYAAICAARESLLFADPRVFKPADPKPYLNPLTAPRGEPWQPPSRP